MENRMEQEIRQELEQRRLPSLLGKEQTAQVDWGMRRAEILAVLRREFAGAIPDFPLTTEGRMRRTDAHAYGDKAQTHWLEVSVSSPFSSFSFPFTLTLPKQGKAAPVFVYLSFTPQIAEGVGEELLDAGYGIANVWYQDIAADRPDEFFSGAGRFYSRNPYDSWGKLGMWAWGASRILDVLRKQEGVDPARIAVMGFSRLGKAALWAGGQDERFSLTVSVESGGGGAALFRGKSGERIRDLNGEGSRIWFCGNFFQYVDREEELPFDQHFLLALTCPRHLYVCSAEGDSWSDPRSEFLSCAAASAAWEACGEEGLCTNGGFPKPGQLLHQGNIGYHLRTGTHYLSRYDWQQILRYRELHQV